MITFLSSLSVAQMTGLALVAIVVIGIIFVAWPKNTNSKHFGQRKING